MNGYLSFFVILSILIFNTSIFASETETTYNFSPKAIENVPDIVQMANSPNLNDRISLLDKLIVKVPHSDTLAYNFVYDLLPEDYSAAVISVLKGGLFTIEDIEKIQMTYIKIDKAITKFKLTDLLPEIVPLLEHDDPIVKLITLGILGQLEAKQYAKEIVKAALNPNRDISDPAIEMLIKFEVKEAVPVLISCLKKEGSRYKINSIEALGRIGDPNAIPALVPYLKSDLYGQTIIALVELDAKETVPNIKDAMLYVKENGQSPHWDEVLLFTSLAYFGDEQAIKDIMSKLIENEDMRYTSYLDRLVAINVKPIIPDLIKALEDEKIIGGQSNRGPNLVRDLMITIAKMNAIEAVPVLKRYLNIQPVPSDIDDFLESGAIQALGILKAKEVIPDLLQKLESENKGIHYGSIRSAAAMALARIGEPATFKNIFESVRKKLVGAGVLCQLSYTLYPDIYNNLLKEYPHLEGKPIEEFIKQLNEKGEVKFSLSNKVPIPDEIKNRIVSGFSGPSGLDVIDRILTGVLNYDSHKYTFYIDDGVIRFVEIEEAYDLWESWINEYMKNHTDDLN